MNEERCVCVCVGGCCCCYRCVWFSDVLQSNKKGLLERLAEGVVIGDGGMIWAMELKGYAEAGKYTPEAAVEHPEAGIVTQRETGR